MKWRGEDHKIRYTNKHTHLVIEKHVDCKWIDAERDGDDKRDRKKEKR